MEYGLAVAIGRGGHGYALACSLQDGGTVVGSKRGAQQGKLGIIGLLLAEIVFKQGACYVAHHFLLRTARHHGRADALQLALVVNLGLLGEVAQEHGLQLLRILVAVLLVERLLRRVDTGNLLLGGGIKFQQVAHLLTVFVGMDIHAVRFVAMLHLLLVEDGHEVDVEVLFRLGGASLVGVAHEDVAVEHRLVALPFHAVGEYLEFSLVLLRLYGQIFHQEIEEMGILLVYVHRRDVVLDLLLVVHSALDAQVVFLVLLVLLEILACRGGDDLPCRGADDVGK